LQASDLLQKSILVFEQAVSFLLNLLVIIDCVILGSNGVFLLCDQVFLVVVLPD